MTTTDKKVRILCVEDDAQMRTFLQAQLKARNFQVQTVRDGAQAIDMAAIFQPQLVLLDLSLPSLDGLTFLRRLREWSGAPVIVLSAHDEEPVKIKALDLGADDYVTKPFSHRELLARIRAVWRRAAAAETPDHGGMTIGDLRLDFDRHEVSLTGRPVDLTPKEYEILHCLALNSGRVVPHERLLAFVWGSLSLESDVDQLKVHVRHLREKLERNPSAPEYLLTLRGVGYKLTEP